MKKVQAFEQKCLIDFNQFDLIMPIPLHPTRLRERGYNQSALIAQKLSKEFNIPLINNNLIRIRNTPSQTNLNKKERWTNIKGAFKIKYPTNINKKFTLLIDDLLTTGATTSEAALTLKKSGAKKVGVLTIAIA